MRYTSPGGCLIRKALVDHISGRERIGFGALCLRSSLGESFRPGSMDPLSVMFRSTTMPKPGVVGDC